MRRPAWLLIALFLMASCSPPTPEPKPTSGPAAMDRTVLPIAEPPAAPITDARRARREGAAALRGEGAEGRAQRGDRADRRHRLRRTAARSADRSSMPTLEKLADERAAVQPLPHHGAVQPDAHGAAHRPQPPREQRRRDHGAGHGLPRQHRRPADERSRTLAEILRQNGYSTAAFGKYHETPPWEVSVSGPYDRWPTGSGFDKFYGFIGGETNQWAPAIYDGVDARRAPADARLPLHRRT